MDILLNKIHAWHSPHITKTSNTIPKKALHTDKSHGDYAAAETPKDKMHSILIFEHMSAPPQHQSVKKLPQRHLNVQQLMHTVLDDNKSIPINLRQNITDELMTQRPLPSTVCEKRYHSDFSRTHVK